MTRVATFLPTGSDRFTRKTYEKLSKAVFVITLSGHAAAKGQKCSNRGVEHSSRGGRRCGKVQEQGYRGLQFPPPFSGLTRGYFKKASAERAACASLERIRPDVEEAGDKTKRCEFLRFEIPRGIGATCQRLVAKTCH